MQPSDKISFVLFGATGNLALLKIWPALFLLFKKGALGTNPSIVASGRRVLTDDEFKGFIKSNVKIEDREVAESLLLRTTYQHGSSSDESLFESIKNIIDPQSKIYVYLSVAPVHYEEIVRGLDKVKLAAKMLIEKPFGVDLLHTEALFKTIRSYFKDDDIFLVDHYLGKSGLNFLIEKRVSDKSFDQRLNNKSVQSIACSFIENIDVGSRGEFYDTTGAYRDVGGNHLLIMLSAVVSDISAVQRGIWSNDFRLLGKPYKAIFGQYEGYRGEVGVTNDSLTDTYFHIETYLDNPRWASVPITLQGGKALDRKESSIEIKFKDGEVCVFDMDMVKGYNSYESILGSVFLGHRSLVVRMSDVLVFQEFNDRVLTTKHDLIIYKKGTKDF